MSIRQGRRFTFALVVAAVFGPDRVGRHDPHRPDDQARRRQDRRRPRLDHRPRPHPRRQRQKPLRVLFIGNSYTFFNGGLGTAVKSPRRRRQGRPAFEYIEVTKGGQTLEGHWNDGKALAAIRKGGWDFVVLQEHSLGARRSREKMFQYAKMFDAEIRKTGAKTVFYETWGRKNRPEMYGVVEQAYVGLATQLKAVVAPAGAAWTMALKSNPTLALHIADLSHPTPAGTYLNACVFYETFFGKSPEGLPRTIKNAAGKVLDRPARIRSPHAPAHRQGNLPRTRLAQPAVVAN